MAAELTGKLTLGAHHIGLAVHDHEEARDFFCQALGFAEVGGKPEYPSIFVSDGSILLTLWRVAEPSSAVRFDRRGNIGLHHLALRVADEETLAQVYDRVRAHPGVEVEFAPEPISPGSAVMHFICAIPGGIRVEFATPFA